MADTAPNPRGGLTPHLTVRDRRAVEAIEFYTKAFGATEQFRLPEENGTRLMHASMTLNGADLMLNDEFPEYQGPADTGNGPPNGLTLHLEVDDADAWFARAVAAGAEAIMPPTDMFWGARYGQVRDPFGYRWAMAHNLPTAA